MASLILNMHRVIQGEDPAVFYAAHTCPLDGYVYACGDPTDGTIIWYLGACPVDAVKTALTTRMTSIVTQAYGDQIDPDPHRRVLSVIARSNAHAKEWLLQHAIEDIAHFLSDDLVLMKLIIAEMTTQGMIAP